MHMKETSEGPQGDAPHNSIGVDAITEEGHVGAIHVVGPASTALASGLGDAAQGDAPQGDTHPGDTHPVEFPMLPVECMTEYRFMSLDQFVQWFQNRGFSYDDALLKWNEMAQEQGINFCLRDGKRLRIETSRTYIHVLLLLVLHAYIRTCY